MTALRRPLSLSPRAPAQAFLSPLARGQGRGRNCVGIQGPYLFLLPFLGAAWAEPRKERDREADRESERKGECPPARSSWAAQRLPWRSHSPFPPRLGGQPHTGKVEPLDGTIRVVTANHLSIGDLVTKAIGGFVGIHRHIQHIRGVDTAKGH